jgi:hypothetical protein
MCPWHHFKHGGEAVKVGMAPHQKFGKVEESYSFENMLFEPIFI